MSQKMNIGIAIVSGMIGSLLGIALIFSTNGLWAQQGITVQDTPDLVSYQGFLTDNNTNPLSSTVELRFRIYDAPTGGTLIETEVISNVQVVDGLFSVLIPFDATDFKDMSGTTRYLDVAVDSGSGFTTLQPRQRFASVPYAFHAENAELANIAQTALSVEPYENVIVVAKSAGDYTTVNAAITAATNGDNSDGFPDASMTRPYLIYVAPGIYAETSLVVVPNYVHLKGAGIRSTIITSNRSANCTPGTLPASAATVQVQDGGQLSYLAVENTGSSNCSAAIYAANIDDNDTTNIPLKNTILTEVFAEANGTGGTYHYGLYANDADFLIKASTFRATGESGAGYNAGIGNYNGAAPRIWDSFLRADGVGQISYGLLAANSASNPLVRNSNIYGITNAVRAEGGAFIDVGTSYINGIVGPELSADGGGIQAHASKVIANAEVDAFEELNSGTVTCLNVSNSTNTLEFDCN